jgi:hypothetical protein
LGVLQEQEVEIALASVRERVLEVHVARALELITQTRDQLPTWRGLAVYCQLHRLGSDELTVVRTRVLARLGQRVDARMGGAAGLADLAAAEEWDSPWSWLKKLRRRLQGRQNLALRRWLELHSGRTESELLSVHVGGAIRLVELLRPEGGYAEVVQIYTERDQK